MKLNNSVFGPETESGAGGGSAELSPEDISGILSFDPFGEEKSSEEKEAEKESETEAADAAEVEAPESSSDPEIEQESEQAPAAAAAPQTSAEMETLRQQNAWLQQQMAQVLSQQKPAPTKQEDKPAVDAVPDYQFQMPQQLMALLDSEDPAQRSQGLAHFAAGIAQTVHREVMRHVKEQTQEVAQSVPRTVQSAIEQRTKAQEIFQDFYGAYKDLNNPALYSLVQSVAAQVLQANPQQPWSPSIRDSVARGVYQVLGKPFPAKVNGTPKKKQPAMAGRGTASGGRGTQDNGPNTAVDIDRVLFGN